MDCSIIIVSWNVAEDLRRCLTSLRHAQKGLQVEVIVVDNASHDGSPEVVRREFPDVRLIEMGFNAGYAKAANRGASEAKGTYLLILNPDAELAPDALVRLYRFMNAHADVGLVSPKIVSEDGSLQFGSLRKNPTLTSQLLIKALHAGPKARLFPPLARYFMVHEDMSSPRPIQQVMGAAMFFRRSAFETVGGFDERYFIWFEDVDICRMLQRRRIPIWFLPDAIVTHRGGQSFKQEKSVRKQWMYQRSMIAYFSKYWRFDAVLVLLVLLPFNLCIVAVTELIRGWYGQRH